MVILTLLDLFYDHSKGEPAIMTQGKSLHPGVIRPLTVRLTAIQKERLLALLTTPSEKPMEPKRCFTPHHGFVFYDADWKVTAHVSLCFQCDNFAAFPKSLPEQLDIGALEAFVRSIGLPVYNDSTGYTKLYRRLEA